MLQLQDTICTVVIAPTLTEFLTQLEAIQTEANWIELRVDYIRDLDVTDIALIKKYTYKRAIFCIRSKREGGYFNGSTIEQSLFLQTANDCGFDYIDIDLTIAEQIHIHNRKAKQIISYHNFEHTPSLAELTLITQEMKKFQPDVYKFSVEVNSEQDNSILINLLMNKLASEKMIVIGMGELGKKIRLLAPLLGSYLTFAANGNAISASGQIDLKALREIYQKMQQVL